MEDKFEEYEYSEFIIDDDEKAEWALKKIKAEVDEHERLQKLITAELDNLKAKQIEIDKSLDDKTSYLKYLLNNYMETVSCKATKTQKTYQLLTGKLVHKFGGTEYIKDEDALIDWALGSRPLLVKVKQTIDWAALKKEIITDENGLVMTADGEIIECIKAEKKPDSFDIKF